MKAKMGNENLLKEKVEYIVEQRIRPILQLHKGDLIVKDVHDGQVRVAFAGACKNCPTAQITLEETVEQILKEELGNELTSVHLVNDTDEKLLDFARELLNKRISLPQVDGISARNSFTFLL